MIGDLERPAYGHFAAVEVRPLEPQQLALPQARMHGDDVKRLVTRAPRGVEQRAYLRGGERFYAVRSRVAGAMGSLARRHVTRDQVVADGLRERLLERDVDVIYRPRAKRLAFRGVQFADFGAGEVFELTMADRGL